MDFVTVFSSLNEADVQLVRSRLEAADFLVKVKNETTTMGLLGAGAAQVQVPEDRAEDAKALLESDESSSS